MNDPARREGLIGRERELGMVAAMLDRIADGGQAQVIVGEPGVGKTALLGAVAEEARLRGVRVLAARGAESERHLSFAALHDLLRPLLARMDSLASGHRAALSGAFGLAAADSPPELFFVALAALELVADWSAEQPILLAVDDFQWVDAASRDVVEFIGRRLASESAILVVTTRPDPFRPWEPDGASGISVQALGSLDDDAARDLLRERAPDLLPADRDRILAEAAGNPLALLELPLAAPAEAGTLPLHPEVAPLTARLERAFAARLPDLSALPRLLILLAALNDSQSLSEVVQAATTAVGHPISAGEIDDAVELALLKIDGDVLTFRHPLVRSAVLQSASAETRRSAHRALAEALAAEPDRYAWHRAASAPGPDEAVAQILEQAADRALGRGAPSSAEPWLEKAAELSEEDGPRGRRLLRAAEIAFQLGNPTDVHRFMAQARPLRLDATERGLFAFLEGAFDDGTPGDADGVRRLIDSAARARDEGEPDIAANLLVGAAIRCWWGEPGQPIRDELLAVADTLPLDADDPRLLAAWAVAGKLERHRHVVDALVRWSARPDVDPAAGALLARAAFVCGEFERTLTFSRPAADGLRQQGRLGVLANVLVLRTFASLYLGRWDLMETAADEALRLSSETRQPVWEACSGLAQANLAGLRGAAQLSADLLAVPERVAVHTGNEAVMNGAQLSKGLRELGRENPAEAYWQLRRMLDPRDHAFHPVQQFWAVDYLAEAAVGAGEVESARELVAALEPSLDLAPGIGVHRAMRFAQALLAEDSEAEAAFERAYELAQTAPPWYRARLDLAHGAWLRRKRHGAGARIPLQAAHGVFESLGAAAWAERAARELRAAGVKDQITVVPELASLSPQELQIARLVAKGLSNRDIGQQLYLSHRTIGSHLYRIFPKLGITSRAQLHSVLPPEYEND